MYTRLNEEIERTPCNVKVLLCLTSVSTLLLVIIFTAFLVSLSDMNTLLTDGAKTLQDFQRLMPDAKESLQLLHRICKRNPKLC